MILLDHAFLLLLEELLIQSSDQGVHHSDTVRDVAGCVGPETEAKRKDKIEPIIYVLDFPKNQLIGRSTPASPFSLNGCESVYVFS